MNPRQTLDILLENAVEYDNRNEFLRSYDCYEKALKRSEELKLTEYVLFSKLGLVDCELSLATVDIPTAQQRFEELKSQAKKMVRNSLNGLGLAITRIEKELINLEHLKNQAAYQFSRAQNVLDAIYAIETQPIDDVYDYEDEADENARITEPQQIGTILDIKNKAKQLTLIQEAIDGIRGAIVEFEKDKLVRNLETAKTMEDELFEKLADCYFDCAEESKKPSAKIELLKKAGVKYESLINKKEELKEQIDISVYLSRLNVWEKLARVDVDNAPNYRKLMVDYISSKQLQAKIEALKDVNEQAPALSDLISHLEFCANPPETKRPIEVSAQSEFTLPLKKRKEEAKIANSNLVFFNPCRNEAMTQINKLEAFKNHLKKFIDLVNGNDNKEVFAEILREVGRLHRKNNLHLDAGLGAQLAKECYQNSMALNSNSRTKKELIELMKNDSLADKTLCYPFETCKNEGATGFFWSAISAYYQQMTQKFPQRENEITQEIFKYLCHPLFQKSINIYVPQPTIKVFCDKLREQFPVSTTETRERSYDYGNHYC